MSRPAARTNAATSAALSRNRWWPCQCPVRPCPGRSTATTRRPVAASAGPTRHQMAADDVTPWISSSGRAAGSPQASADHGIPAASTLKRSPAVGARERAPRRRRAGPSSIMRPDRSTSRADRIPATPVDRRRTVTAMANQFVVQLKNEPGAMATLAEALAARGVDLRAIGGGSIGDSGHVIMTTADDDDDQGRARRAGLRLHRGRVARHRGRRQAGRHGPPVARPGRCRREHPRPPVPRPLGRSGDVRVRRRQARRSPARSSNARADRRVTRRRRPPASPPRARGACRTSIVPPPSGTLGAD